MPNAAAPRVRPTSAPTCAAETRSYSSASGRNLAPFWKPNSTSDCPPSRTRSDFWASCTPPGSGRKRTPALTVDGYNRDTQRKDRNMIRKIAKHKRIGAAIIVALGALGALAALAFTGSETTPTLPDPLPPMTITYEVYGGSVSVGNRSIPRFKEIRQLEYRSQTDWKETVLESPTLDLGRYGTGSNAGSYRQVKGNVETEYDAMTDTTSTNTLGGTSVNLPHSAMRYAYYGTRPMGPSITGGAVVTEARVCFNGDCRNDAAGIKYTSGDHSLVVLEGGDWIIPMKVGDGFFTLKSAEIQADRPQ